MRRIRLDDQIVGPAAPRLTLVVAPAGCGKTTLLAHAASDVAPRSIWLSLDHDLAAGPALLGHLFAAFRMIPEFADADWQDIDDLLNTLDSQLADRMLLVIDDAQVLADGPALELVRRLLTLGPTRLHVAMGSRIAPDIGLERLRLTSRVREIGPDDLRFRTWEIEELFRTCHDVRLGSVEVSQLARSTAGWAAGLQLFHLATAGRPASARSRVLAGVGSGRLTSRYLAEQILTQLNLPTLEFALRSSVLVRLSAARCDLLLDRSDSAAMLAELERLGLLIRRVRATSEGPDEYEYHEVLQTHLLASLETRWGAAQSRDLHARAGQVWLAESAFADAVQALGRAQDWAGVAGVVERGGRDLADDRGGWLDVLPEAIQRSDPWVALAMARRLLADGSMAQSRRQYERSLQAFGGLSGAHVAGRELSVLRSWMDPPLGTVDSPVHLIRTALMNPRLVPRPTDSSAARWCAYGLACLVMGQVGEAVFALEPGIRESGPNDPAIPQAVEALAFLGHAIALTMAGDPRAAQARLSAAEVAASVDIPFLERIGDGLVRILGPRRVTNAAASIADLLAACRKADDRWGEAVLRLVAVIRGTVVGRSDNADAGEVGRQLRELQAGALAAWAGAAEAIGVARAGDSLPVATLAVLDRSTAAIGPGPHALALMATALGTADVDLARRAEQAAVAAVDGTGLAGWVDRLRVLGRRRRVTAAATVARNVMPVRAGPRPSTVTERSVPGLRLRVLGGFEVTLGGMPLDCDALRPLHRELLGVFCAYAGQVVERDRVIAWFWPDRPRARAAHSLQVAVHELRRMLDGAGGGDRNTLHRKGSGYELQLDGEMDCDARALEFLVAQADEAERAGDPAAATDRLEAAVGLYRGELMPNVGYPEWVLVERDRLHQVGLTAFERLVELLARTGRHREAVAAARGGLALDRYRDCLWRNLERSLLALDERAAAATAAQDYHTLLAELAGGPQEGAKDPSPPGSIPNGPAVRVGRARPAISGPRAGSVSGR